MIRGFFDERSPWPVPMVRATVYLPDVLSLDWETRLVTLAEQTD